MLIDAHLAGCLTAAALACAIATPIPASAIPIPVSPSDPEAAVLWNNPEVRSVDQVSHVSVLLEKIEHSEITVKLTNNTLETVHHVSARIQRAEPVENVQAARTVLASDQSAFGTATPFEALDLELSPEQSLSFTLKLDREQLGLTKPGIYPLLINVNGKVGQQSDSYLTSERTLIQVGELEKKDTPLSLILPVTAEKDVLPGETGEAPNAPLLFLESDNLATQLAADGRLTKLLEAFSTADTHSCLAIDPELVDIVDRMRGGYHISTSRPNPVASRPRLRDSWNTNTDKVPGIPGSGADSASAWITRLQQIDKSGACIIPLPWANTDLEAVARTGNPTLMNEAVARGNLTLTRVLGHPVTSNTVIPGQGYVDKRTASALSRVPAADPESSFEVPHNPSPWRVLVADNTAGELAPGIDTLTFDPALGATLADLGDNPDTVGYGNQWARVDARLDSHVARRLTAQASLALAASGPDPVVAVAPSDLAAEDARALIQTTNQLFTTGHARPVSVTELPAAAPTAGPAGSPYEDPAQVTDTEVLRATQQGKSIDDLTALMTNDSAIALTRYNFTNPLRHDLLRALSVSGRRSMSTHETATARADSTLNSNRDTQQSLRTSVALLPPGNVYTRTSASSPLLIVAQNGLPLPVDAHLGYSGPEGATIHVPDSLRIPARGSITAQMTADLPNETGRTDLTVWLAAQSGAPISMPVEISVQTRSGLLGIGGVAAAVLAIAGFVVFRLARRRGQ